MTYFLVENFNSGLDLRRSIEVAPPGSLRVLRNASVNAGGEIEKRKSFTLDQTLTAYCQTNNYKGRITGPHAIPGYPNSAFFRHRHDSLPGWTAGSGSVAEYTEVGSGFQTMRFWAMKTTTALTSFGAMLHTASGSQFAAKSYVVEKYVKSTDNTYAEQHFQVTHTNGEPTAEAAVSANANRAFQMTLDQKGYVVEGDILYASAVGDPTDMAGTGSGSLNISSQGATPIGAGFALAEYFGELAVCGRRGVQFYSVDPDFDQNQYQRTVTTQIFAPRSLTGYADGDVIYLGKNGIRSLQARDSSNYAMVTDVGSPIDRLIIDALRYLATDEEPIFSPASPDLPLSDFFDLAKGVVHPGTGEFWLFLREKIYVLSRHPGSRVLAWSTHDMPTVTSGNSSSRNGPIKSRWCADACPVGETIVFRNFADEVFVVGGDDAETYDNDLVEVVLPFMDMGEPGHYKHFTGLDLVCAGSWRIEIATKIQPEASDVKWITVADQVNGTTRNDPRIPLRAHGTQIALRLTSTSAERATLSQIAIYFQKGSEK
ncbi:hypothetical protein [uncultured Maritimibacter sp.]|uniref:hypothetical protein n=1 Tax=uncultured Maritimibacter sp. TaxID=991866 RepID=UPI00259351E6|nr:hypothetical protein [uncultured Maritimibacter sp.]